MALYAIGDVQGCYDSLRQLLDKIRFDPAHDELWFTGDLVNRGPCSAEVLRFVSALGARATSVLGNHDLHLLAVAAGVRPLSSHDTFQDVLTAPDRDALIAWLTQCPLLYRHPVQNLFLVHAGILPQWNMSQAQTYAREAESIIRGSSAVELYRHMYGNQPDVWHENLKDWDRLRLIINSFTRLRFCFRDGKMDYAHKGAPGSQPAGLFPWFTMPQRQSKDALIVFGHWSLAGQLEEQHVIGLDTGCCWGGRLTAIQLGGQFHSYVSIECPKKDEEAYISRKN